MALVASAVVDLSCDMVAGGGRPMGLSHGLAQY